MIYVFSGTGNTLHIAEELAKALTTHVHVFTPWELRNPASAKLITYDKLIVWMFPTYSWGVPPVVRAIIRAAEFTFDPHATHIAVTSCGDDVGQLAKMWRSDMRARDLNTGAVFSVEMPNTYVMMKGFDTDSTEAADKKLRDSHSRINFIAEQIINGHTEPKDDNVTVGKYAWLKTNVIYPWFTRFKMSPKGFEVRTEACIGCGKCEQVCPMTNIYLDNFHNPVWGDKCAFCTACYHVCPKHAIEWHNATNKKRQQNTFLSEKATRK